MHEIDDSSQAHAVHVNFVAAINRACPDHMGGKKFEGGNIRNL